MTKYDYLIMMLGVQVIFGKELSLHNILIWSAIFMASWAVLNSIFGKKGK